MKQALVFFVQILELQFRFTLIIRFVSWACCIGSQIKDHEKHGELDLLQELCRSSGGKCQG